MNVQLNDTDLQQVNSMASRYGISVSELGKLLIKHERKNNQRQFRVSAKEYSIIHKKATERNMTLMCFCEYACNEFLKKKEIDKRIFSKQYGEGREKRIAVTFKNNDAEKELISYAEQLGIEIGTLIRCCVLCYGKVGSEV